MNATINREVTRNSQLSLLQTFAFGTLADTDRLLELTVDDVSNTNQISFYVGPDKYRKTLMFSDVIRSLIDECSIEKSSTDLIFDQCSKKDIDRDAVIAAWINHYYSETGDIYYPQHLLNLSEQQVRKLIK